MPLLGNKIHVLNPVVKKERKSKDGMPKEEPKKHKYVITNTSEICDTEEEYKRKNSLYSQRIWTCRCTGKLNMNHKEAQKSEQVSLRTLRKAFPKCFEKAVLEIVHHSTDSLDVLVHKAWSMVHSEFCLNEPIRIKVNHPGKSDIVGVIVKVDRITEESPKPNGTTTSSPSNSDKENTGKKSTPFPARKSHLYSVKLLNEDKIVSRIPASAIERDFRPPYKEHIRMFIRARAMRYGVNFTGPWVVDDEFIKKHKITSKNHNYEVDKARLKEQSRLNELEYYQRVLNKTSGSVGSSQKKVKKISVLRGEIENEEEDDIPLLQLKRRQLEGKLSGKKLKQVTLFDLGKSTPKAGGSVMKTPFMTPNRIPPLAQRLIKSMKDKKNEAVVSQLVTRCAQLLTDTQIQMLPAEVREKVRSRKEKIDEKKKMAAMTEEEREEFMRKKRLEFLASLKEKRREQNRRYEDTEITDAQSLPSPSPVPLPEGMTSTQFGRLMSLSEFVRCFRGLLVPPEAAASLVADWSAESGNREGGAAKVDRLAEALTSGEEGCAFLGQTLTILLTTLLQDSSMSSRRELGLKLSEIPVTPCTSSEMLRLVLQPLVHQERKKKRSHKRAKPSAKKQASKGKENGEKEAASDEERASGDSEAEDVVVKGSDNDESSDSEGGGDDDLYATEATEMTTLCERLGACEFHQLTVEEKLSALEALQRRLLDLEMLNDHIEECQRLSSEVWKKRIAELKRRNDRMKEEKAKRKQEREGKQKNKENKKTEKKGDSTTGTPGEPAEVVGSDDLASVVKRRRQLAAVAAADRERREKEDKERRQLEAAAAAETRALQAVDKEFFQTTLEAREVLRQTPLGSDRFHRRYWHFLAGMPGIYVEQHWAGDYLEYSVRPEGYMEDDEQKDMDKNWDEGAQADFETTIPSLSTENTWFIFDTEEQLDALMAALLQRGARESRLRTEIAKVLEEEKARIRVANKAKKEINGIADKDVEDILMSGFKTELRETNSRLRNGVLGGVVNMDEWLERLSNAESREELAHCLLAVSSQVNERFICGPLAPKKEVNDEEEETLVESPMMAAWQEAALNAPTQSRLNLLQGFLDACIRWEKSIEDAKCRICRRKSGDERLLLCDGCNQAFHLYCLRPPLASVPTGSWFCQGCKPNDRHHRGIEEQAGKRKRAGHSDDEEDDGNDNDSTCLVCEGSGDELVLCSGCPNTFHVQCHEPPLRHAPRGDWYCSDCRRGTRLRQRLRGRQTAKGGSVKGKKAQKKGARGSRGQTRIQYVEPQSDDEEEESGSEQQSSKRGGSRKRPQQQQQQRSGGRRGGSAKKVKQEESEKEEEESSASEEEESEAESESSEAESQSKRRSGRIASATKSKGSVSRTRRSATKKRAIVSSDSEEEVESKASSVQEGAPSKKRRKVEPSKGAVKVEVGKQLVDSLFRHRSAWPFQEPVDLEEVPDYMKVIESPVDLSTMKEKLREGLYTKFSQVVDDIRLMFINAATYNAPQDDVYATATRLEQFFVSQLERLAPDVEYSRVFV